MFKKYRLLALAMAMAIVTVIAIAACSPAEPQVITEQVEVTRVVTEQVEKVVEVEKPVEVVVEKEVEKIVEKEVEVEKVVTEQVEVTRVVEVMAPEGPKEAIIFGDLNWSSALLQNRIAQYIVEKGYGYPTDVKFGATLPLFQGLKNGDTDVTMEIWLPNQDEAWNAAREEGAVLSVGQSLGKDWQSAFVIPAYLQEQYPDLDSVEDLKDQQYKDLFKTAESGDKARLVSCIIGWACESVNAAQIKGYELEDHVHVINPGDGAALNADLYGAYERQEPWLGYQWGTNDPALILDLVRLEEPPFSAACWADENVKPCGYQDATILIAVNPDLPGRAGDVVEMLRKWDFNIEIYKSVARWQGENPDADVKATALWWLNNNADIWGGWVTDEAAEGIQAALSAGEEAEGWPTE
ncbi:MAG: ABC transporter substrate-binding protein [Chloroflexi bacterium]|nr:ABC transporter substrate-binding protein [Chloroflexota bacterium]